MQYTRQQMIYKIYEYFILNKGLPGENKYQGGCNYRINVYDNDQRLIGVGKCAVGCLIPDEIYHPTMEGSICNQGFFREFVEIQTLFKSKDIPFLRSIQIIHDNYFSEIKSIKSNPNIDFYTYFENELKKYCLENSLDYPGEVNA